MSGNCGTALGLWIKNRGEKKTLLLKRRSLSLLSSAIPGAREGLPSLPRDTTEPASAAAAQNTGSTCTPCCRGGGGPQVRRSPLLFTSNRRPSIQLPATLLDTEELPPANPKERPWDGSQPKSSKGHCRATAEGQALLGVKSHLCEGGPGTCWSPRASSLSGPMEGSGPTSSPGFLPRAWTGSKAQHRQRASATTGTQQHILTFWVTLNGCMQTQWGNWQHRCGCLLK